MRKRLFFISLFLVIFTLGIAHGGPDSLPRPSGYVSDFSGIISAQYKTMLESFISKIERKTTAEIAVVTVKSLDGEPIENYAVRLFERWGIGKKGKDNGILILVAPRERKLRIEVGYGLEGAIPDGLAGEIRDQYLLPYFKIGNYGEGIWNATVAIAAIIGKEYNVDLLSSEGLDESLYQVRTTSPAARLLGNILYLLILILIFGGRFWFFPLFFGLSRRRGYWSGGGYYSGGGGFGGGFGGFGGGMSGGGGASGSW